MDTRTLCAAGPARVVPGLGSATVIGASQDHPSKKPYRVITVRLPVDLHRQLKDAAHDKRPSLKQLCVGTLLALVDGKGQPVADHAEQEPVLARVGEAA